MQLIDIPMSDWTDEMIAYSNHIEKNGNNSSSGL